MKKFFAFVKRYSAKSFKLKTTYSLEDFSGPAGTLALDQPEKAPFGFLDKFQYSIGTHGRLDDMLLNSMGWHVLSGRLAKTLEREEKLGNVELLPLPTAAVKLNEELRDYRVLGVKRTIQCVDEDESDILWDFADEGRRKYILSFRNCVLKEKLIPTGAHIFLLAECPVFPLISGELAMDMAEHRPSGFELEVIEAR